MGIGLFERKIVVPPGTWENINGPCVVEVPNSPLGRYHLYYANHIGKEIRLAYTNDIEGHWTLHHTPVLKLEDTPCDGHIASPDVIVRSETKLLMRFHGPYMDKQQTLMAISNDSGVTFEFAPKEDIIPTFYFKYLTIPDTGVYGIAKNGNLGGEIWQLEYVGGHIDPFEWVKIKDIIPNMRHAHAVYNENDGLIDVYYTRIGDAPESICLAKFTFPEFQMVYDSVIYWPQYPWEGVGQLIEKSSKGGVFGLHHQLRDPFYFKCETGEYLFYAAGGEHCIGMLKMK